MALTEVLVVVVVLAILAMLVTPRIAAASRAAREAALQADLHLLRQAVENFRADTGGHPLLLRQLLHTEAPAYALVPPEGRLVRVMGGTFRGPYLATSDGRLPADPLTGNRSWSYDWRTGEVHSQSEATALDGTTYAEW